MMTEKEKEEILWERSFFLIADQPTKDFIFNNGFGKQYKEICDRLTAYHVNQVLDMKPTDSYNNKTKYLLAYRIREFLDLGIYIHCVDLVYIHKKFDNYQGIKIADDPGLRDYLIKEIEIIEDTGEVRKAIEPPEYIINTIKQWYLFFLHKMLPKDKLFERIKSEEQRKFLMKKIIWMIVIGYLLAYIAECDHKE